MANLVPTGLPADAAFSQADLSGDGRIDLGEFRNFLGNNLAGAGGYSASSSYESSSYGDAGLVGAGAVSYDAGALAGASSYESSSYAAGSGYDAGYAAGGVVDVSGAGLGVANTQVSHYAANAQGIYQDPNPQIIRRPNASGVQTYTQNIRVRFLQPPPVPPHGPLIIREVRPAQPPVPPPLRVVQRGRPFPPPPPLVLRERPPQPPAVIAAQTVIRRLPGLPVPPRSVIIERIPPLPPRPRDVIIERWVPYGAQRARQTLVQRAPAPRPYPAPRNVIIQYEPAQVRIVRQFQRLGVTAASPAAYVQTYGASLLDASSLVAQARAAGVVEDISAPLASASYGFSAATYGQDAALVGGSAGFVGGSAGFVDGGVVGVESAGASLGGGFSSSGYEYSSGAGFGGAYGASYGAADAFDVADTNDDGVVSRGEFNNFLSGSVGY